MTGSLVSFENSTIETVSDRLSDLVLLAKFFGGLMSEEGWDDDFWRVEASFISKGRNTKTNSLAFYTLETKLNRKNDVISGEPLPEPFKTFAKAYLNHSAILSKPTFPTIKNKLLALKYIEASFRSLNLPAKIEDLNVVVLNTAVQLVKENVGQGRAFHIAGTIQKVHSFLSSNGLLSSNFHWSHSVAKPTVKAEGVGDEARKWRDKKLPSPEAYLALAHIFCNAETFKDRLYSALTAIMVSVPIRVHEVLQLRNDCEVNEKITDEETGEEREAYGLRVFPGKGNPPQIKWVPTPMVTTIREAVSRIREMCDEAREIAGWYEQNQNQLWLPDHVEKYRQAGWIPIELVPDLLTKQPKNVAADWIRKHGVEWRPKEGGPSKVMAEINLSSLSERLLKDMPPSFPYFNGDQTQPYSQTLAVIFKGQAHETRGTFQTLIEQVTVQSFSQWLTGHDSGKIQSVFDRWGFAERDGSPIRITTHAFRHWLNTVAQLKGLSELDIAKWSGRDLTQNKHYNHVTPQEMMSNIRNSLADANSIGFDFDTPTMSGTNKPVAKSDFEAAQIGSALTTDFGICIHDYSLLPCQSHGDCVNCSENVFIKGDAEHKLLIENKLTLALKQLTQAEAATTDQHFGADRWVQTHKLSVSKLREMIGIHNDTNIIDGSVVRLSNTTKDGDILMSLRDQKSQQKGKKTDRKSEKPEDLSDILGDMWGDS